MKSWKFLLLLFICLIVVKSLLVSLVPAPSMFSDEYEYAKMAQSFWQERNFNVHDVQSNAYPPLYAVVISPSYAFKDMRIVYFIIKFINVLLTSLVIFPTYLLAKEIMSKRMALLSTLIIAFLPGTFSLAPLIMSENLFMPLAMLTIYLIYKTMTSRSCLLGFLAGVFAALSFFTRTVGIVLVASVALLLMPNLKTFKDKIRPLMFTLIGLLAIWIIKSKIIVSPLLQQYFLLIPPSIAQPTFAQVAGLFLFWLVIYFGYITIATGFLPILSTANRIKSPSEKERSFFILFWVIIAIGIGIVAKQNITTTLLGTTPIISLAGRPLGRYVEYLFPLIIIGWFASLKNTRINKKISSALIMVAIVSIIFLSSFVLLPVNNGALSLLGSMKFIYEHLFGKILVSSVHYFLFTTLSAILLITFVRILLKNYNKKRLLISLLAIFFISTSLLNYTLIAQNSREYWYNGEQMQLGLWINDREEFAGKTFLIDERDEGKILKLNQEALYENGTKEIPGASTIIGFWLNNPIKIGNVDNLQEVDYVLSKHKLDLQIIKQTEKGVCLYKTK